MQSLRKNWCTILQYYPKASVSETWGIREDCGLFFPIDSEMAGPIGLKLGGLVEEMCEIVLAKEFF